MAPCNKGSSPLNSCHAAWSCSTRTILENSMKDVEVRERNDKRNTHVFMRKCPQQTACISWRKTSDNEKGPIYPAGPSIRITSQRTVDTFCGMPSMRSKAVESPFESPPADAVATAAAGLKLAPLEYVAPTFCRPTPQLGRRLKRSIGELW